MEEEELQEIVRTKREEPQPGSIKMFILALCCIALFPVVLALWQALHDRFFERTPPLISGITVPPGIGAAPAVVTLRIQDGGAGLDEVVIRMQQKKSTPREILKKEFNGEQETTITFQVGGEGSGIDTGTVNVVVRAFDRSFWSNSSDATFAFPVDYRKPRADVLTSMHNARIGGAQLAFYRAQDTDRHASGIQVGENYFFGAPAQSIDPEFTDPSLYVVLYAIDPQVPPEISVRVFAQDQVKNTSFGNFYNLVLPRKFHPMTVTSFTETPQYASSRLTSNQVPFSLSPSAWQLPFSVPKGSIRYSYGDELIYKFDNQEVGRELITGYEFTLSPSARGVTAVNDGKVLSVERNKRFGSRVSIDHGLGLTSVYDFLETVAVKKGDTIIREQEIGSAGVPHHRKVPTFFFEMRVQGVPVDAREWWEFRWCMDHITRKISEIRKLSGLNPLNIPQSEKKAEKHSTRG